MGARKVAGMEFALLRGEGPLLASVLVLPLAAFLLYAAFQAVLLSQDEVEVSAAFRGFLPVAVYSSREGIVLEALSNFTRFELVRARDPDGAIAAVERREACMAVVLEDVDIAVNRTDTVVVYLDRSNPKAELALADLVDIVRSLSEPVIRENLQYAVEVEAPIVVEVVGPDGYATASERPLAAAAAGGGGGEAASGAAGQDAAQEAGRAAESSLPLNVIFVVAAFLVGAFLISGMCAMSLAGERIRHQGEFLFSAPLRDGEVLAGKVAPYAGLLAYLVAAVAGYLAWSGLVPDILWSAIVLLVVGALPLSVACLVGTVAVSFHQLTFLLTFADFFIFLVFVVPALLVKLTLAAYVSPVTLLILLAVKAPLAAATAALSSAPSLAATLLALAATSVLFTSENLLFAGPSLPAALSSLAGALLDRLRGRFGELVAFPFATAVALFPLVFVVELVSLFVLFSLVSSLTVWTLLITVPLWALAEEVAKVAGVFVVARRRPAVGSPWAFALMGASAGLGFFAAEKALNTALLSEAVTMDAYLVGVVLVATALSALVQCLCAALAGVGVWCLERRGSAAGFVALFFASVAVHLAADVIIISQAMGAMGW